MMITKIDDYLKLLKNELAGSDPATIQDALADAKEYFTIALEASMKEDPSKSEADLISSLIKEYGSPKETAAAYKTIEERLWPVNKKKENMMNRSSFSRFFGIYRDPHAWSALIYMLTSLLTGTLYFCWAFTGLSLSITFALFIFGLPVALFFFNSLKGLGLIEGRIVEGLLGVQMPRKIVESEKSLPWRQRLVDTLKEPRTWLTFIYMVLQLVFGVLYFSIVIILLALGVTLAALPLLEWIFEFPIIQLGAQAYHLPVEYMPVAVILGFLVITCTLHLAKWIGKIHGRYAKKILVG